MSDQIYINGKAYPLHQSRYVIGREEGCDILMPEDDGTTSRRHAILQRDDNHIWSIVDLVSTNGTFINKRRVADRHRLSDGDSITIGNTTLVLSAPRSIPHDIPQHPAGRAAAPTVQVHQNDVTRMAQHMESQQPHLDRKNRDQRSENNDVTHHFDQSKERAGGENPVIATEKQQDFSAPNDTFPQQAVSPTVSVPLHSPSAEPVTHKFIAPAIEQKTVSSQQSQPFSVPPLLSDVAPVAAKNTVSEANPVPPPANATSQINRCTRCDYIYPATESACPQCGYSGFKTVNSAATNDENSASAYDFPLAINETQPAVQPEKTPFDVPTDATAQFPIPAQSSAQSPAQMTAIDNFPDAPESTFGKTKSTLQNGTNKLSGKSTGGTANQQLMIVSILSWIAAPAMLASLVLPWFQFNLGWMAGQISYARIISMIGVPSASDIKAALNTDPRVLFVFLPVVMVFALIGAAATAPALQQSMQKIKQFLTWQVIFSLIGGVPGVVAGIWFYIQLQSLNGQVSTIIPIVANGFIGVGIPIFVITSMIATAAGVYGLVLMSQR